MPCEGSPWEVSMTVLIDDTELEVRSAEELEDLVDQKRTLPTKASILDRLAVSDRRGFLKSTGLTALGAALGMAVPFGRHFPTGVVPAAFAQDTGADLMSEK